MPFHSQLAFFHRWIFSVASRLRSALSMIGVKKKNMSLCVTLVEAETVKRSDFYEFKEAAQKRNHDRTLIGSRIDRILEGRKRNMKHGRINVCRKKVKWENMKLDKGTIFGRLKRTSDEMVQGSPPLGVDPVGELPIRGHRGGGGGRFRREIRILTQEVGKQRRGRGITVLRGVRRGVRRGDPGQV